MREFEQGSQHADLYANNYSSEQNEAFKVAFDAITEGFKAKMLAGVAASAPEVQELVAQHYAFVSQFWTPSKAAYKSLAMSYLLPSPYRDSYEGFAPGLAKYHYDAIVVWADANLQ